MNASAEAGTDQPAATENPLAKKYWQEYAYARTFDEGARKDYAFCRRYARGDSSYDVSVNLLGTYIDILVAFLYARDPDISVAVSDSVGESRKSEYRLLANTMQVVLSRAWKDAGMRRQAERWLRSSLTTAIGWIKTGWQEVYDTDPEMAERKRDIQENVARINELRTRIDEGVDDIEEAEAELQSMTQGLEAHVEKLVYRGLFIDVVPAEDIQVSLDVQNIVDCETASWIAHRSYVQTDLAKAKLPHLTEDQWSKVPRYHAIQPVDVADNQRKSAHIDTAISHKDADRFGNGASPNSSSATSKFNEFVLIVEMWRGDTNQVCELIEGLEDFASKPAAPNVGTTRFYPFFPLALHEVDGERHPQSLVMRSYKLMDEYHRTRDKFKALRQSIRPRMAFDARLIKPEDTDKVVGGMTGEFVPVRPAVDGATVQQALFEIPVPRIDPSLFDLMPIKTELEALWGIQEALSSTVQVAKTATEAEIQQAGTNARTGAMRERMEQMLSQIAHYHGEIVIQKYSLQDAMDIAGREALWPEGLTVEDLDLLVNIQIAAGSTGKPDTSAQREAWAATAGMIEKMIMQVSQLMMSPPEEQARCIVELMKETLVRAGDQNLDIERFIPAPGQPMALIDPVTGMTVLAHPVQQPGMEGGVPAGDGGSMPAAGDPAAEAVAPVALPDKIA